ncbi:DNA polymerase IV [Acinetobacter sp. MD2(2019)]|uniref:DNA polymerase IV n=1 Tax=Acinetobacter sp. MD2(2019) TaxID=2605273 RepID=UPI002D1F1301|nr:DNA polymerase IV [Acinetobacter sp. MD2(2019)]MEB3755001.1 DNA polymerase IV [Acinetobacter sp. MD2(2019)]
MRKIIHIDMDAFYASVELRERPELHNLPVIIAHDHPRAVVTTASYPARKFGLRSAMSVAQAKKRCPQVIILEPHFDRYRAVSEQIQHIFHQYTELVEPISLDEAYLDVSDNLQHIPSATEVAQRIQHDIWQHTQLTASAGVAPNKFLAKIASDWHKPNGLCVIKPSQVQGFIQNLALNKIPGVGRVTEAKLSALNLFTLGDLNHCSEAFLCQQFGKYGQQLFLYAQGIDHRPVMASRTRQQISKETTFDTDLHLTACTPYWERLANQVWQSLIRKGLSAYGVSIKLKHHNFKLLQHSKRFDHPLHNPQQLQQAIQQLLDEADIASTAQFRLIGVGVYQLIEQKNLHQLSLLAE